MLSFFPTPFPDELFYSLCARYHESSSNKIASWTMDDLFGKEQVAISFHLPMYLNNLQQNLLSDSLLNADFLMEKTTLFPFYKLFLLKERIDKVIHHMKNEGTRNGGIRITAGIVGNNIPTINRLRFCPLCIHDDEEKFGEPYWHRSHQIAGVDICHIHNVELKESGVQDGIANNLTTLHHELKSYEDAIVIANDNSILYKISQEVYYILNNQIPNLELVQFKEKYISNLQKLGLATPSKNIRHKEFLNEFEQFYGKGLLKGFGINKPENNKSYWLIKLLKNEPKTIHPIYHILLINFLGLTIEDFFDNDEKEYKPFGEGPWICLNPIAEHFHQKVIYEVDIHIQPNTKLPLGTFRCSCGYIYTRKGPDKSEKDKYTKTSVKDYGELWEKTLIRLLTEEKKSIRQTAKLLGVDPKTVKNQFSRLNKQNDTSFVEKRKAYRTIWLNLMERNPTLNRTELTKLIKSESNWLYRYDNSWFTENSPPGQLKTNIKGVRRTSYIDWEKRDDEIVELVFKAAEEIKKIKGKPVRLTKTSIGRKIDGVWILQKYLEKLPKTKKLLDSILESHEEYQIRRVQWAALHLNEEGTLLTKNKIIKKAGLLRGYSVKVSEVINCEIENEMHYA